MTGQFPEPDDASPRPDPQPQPEPQPPYPQAGQQPADPPYASVYPPPPPPAPYAQPGFAYSAPLPPAPPTAGRVRSRSRLLRYGAGAAALVVAGSVGFAAGTTRSHTRIERIPQASNGFGSTGFGSGSGSGSAQDPFGSLDPFNPFGDSNGSGSGSAGAGAGGLGTGATATSQQAIGVVDIDTNLQYQGAQAAGTGMVLDSSGDILTNNHVVQGSTSIRVTVVSSGQTYTAKVVGTDPTQDIAVIKVSGASGLTPANFGDSGSVKVGDAVTGVGDAGGTGGTPSAASGKVLALHQSITAADDGGSNAEKLPDVIVSDAPIQPGDSGGPLYNAKDQVVGIDTAANTSGSSQGFSIPINTALSLAHQIMTGNETTSIHIGYPGFLGISVGQTRTASGAPVSDVISGLPAAAAGIKAGDSITRINSTSTPTASALTSAMSGLKPGAQVKVTYVSANGRSHIATLTLASGPAD